MGRARTRSPVNRLLNQQKLFSPLAPSARSKALLRPHPHTRCPLPNFLCHFQFPPSVARFLFSCLFLLIRRVGCLCHRPLLATQPVSNSPSASGCSLVQLVGNVRSPLVSRADSTSSCNSSILLHSPPRERDHLAAAPSPSIIVHSHSWVPVPTRSKIFAQSCLLLPAATSKRPPAAFRDTNFLTF